MNKMKTLIHVSPAFISGLKELLRTALFAALPLLISQFQTGVIDIRAVEIAVIIAILSGFDKWLHKDALTTPKAERNEGFGGVKGLSGF